MKAALELASKKNRDGLFEIYVRIQEGNKKRRVKANIAVAKNQFKSKNHNMQWVRNHPNHKKINADLKAVVDSYNDLVFTGKVQKQVLSPEIIIHTAKESYITSSFIRFYKKKMDEMLEYNQRKSYQQALNKWEDYTAEEKLGDLDFKQITVSMLKGFENHLFKKGLEAGTVHTNLKRIRACFNFAIDEKVITPNDYIFRGYRMPKVPTKKKKRLGVGDLKEFMKQEYEPGSLTKNVQQAFLLAFNMAGVRIEDILTLTWEGVKRDRLEYTMVKGNKAVNSFRLTSKIKEILAYFKSVHDGKNKLIIPIVDQEILKLKYSKKKEENELYKKEIGKKTALVNKYLKKIAEDACIDVTITSHISRHTFSTIALQKTNGDVNFLKNALKHSSLKITENYVNELDEDSLDEKMGRVTDL